MILKVLLIAGVILTVYILFFKKNSFIQNTTTKKKEDKKASDMVECSSCGVYVEVEEAIVSGGNYFCSSSCLSKAK